MNAILSVLGGLFAIILLLLKGGEERKNEKRVLRKEVDDAVESGDLARINSLIQYINTRL